MIKREILSRLENHLASDQMSILVGPRQVGKTYLMQLIKEKLEKEGKKTVWLNLDNEEDAAKFHSQAALLAYIELAVGKEKAFIFIDEIQRKENAGLFLKGIFDLGLSYKFIVSGSGSLELKAKIPESMAGRKQLFLIEPISFAEFANYKTGYQFEGKLDEFLAIEKGKAERLLSEYMVFGGYPRVILADTAAAKQAQMQEIYASFIAKDITNLLALEKSDAIANLLKTIGSQVGSLVNITELANTLGLDQKTIKHYLWYLEQTFILKKVTPYFRNTRSEITKAPIYYFYDVGFRNWLLGLFGLPQIPIPLAGHLFENIVFNLLRAKTELTPTQIHFWRTRDQAEVDFVLETGLELIPVEAKYSKIPRGTINRSYRNFLKRYKPQKGYIVHLGEKYEKEEQGAKISFLPFDKLITTVSF